MRCVAQRHQRRNKRNRIVAERVNKENTQNLHSPVATTETKEYEPNQSELNLLQKLQDTKEGQDRAIKEWTGLNTGQVSQITKLIRSLQQARDTITRRDRENEELRTQMVQYRDECKEYQLKIEELEKEVKQLKLERLDTTKYMEWNRTQILFWICNLESGRYSKYEEVLEQALEEAEVEGDDLPTVNELDVKNWGIKKLKDQKGLIRQIEQLVDSNDLVTVRPGAAYQHAPSEVVSTAFV